MSYFRKNKNKLSYYDRQMRSPLHICLFLYIGYVIWSLLVPLYDGWVLGYTSGFNYLAILVSGIGVYAMHGHFNQTVPLPVLLILRSVQFIVRFLLDTSYKLNLISFISLVICEVILAILEMIDRVTFVYIKEKGDV